VQCLANTDCDSLTASGCKVYTCNTTTKTCAAGANKPVNSICPTGYCSSTGTCGATPFCTFTRTACSNNDATCGTLLKTTIDNAADDAVIGIPAGTYKMPATVVIDSEISYRKLTLVKCEANRPVLDGGWGGGSTTTGQVILNIRNTQLTVDGVNFTNGYNTTWGGAIGLYKGQVPGVFGTDVPKLTLRNVDITNCKAQQGGGLYSILQTNLDNVKITGNTISALLGFGAYFSTYRGTGVTMNNVTITGNTTAYPTNANAKGAGIFINDANESGGTMTCTGTNTISNSQLAKDCGYYWSNPQVTPLPAGYGIFDPANFAGCGCATTQTCPNLVCNGACCGAGQTTCRADGYCVASLTT